MALTDVPVGTNATAVNVTNWNKHVTAINALNALFANDRLNIAEVRAINSNGLKLFEDGGAGIFVKDGGNIGVGITALKSWVAAYTIMQIGGMAALMTNTATGAGSKVYLGLNFYHDGANFKRIIEAGATIFREENGVHTLMCAGSGGSDSVITWIDALKLSTTAVTARGNFGLNGLETFGTNAVGVLGIINGTVPASSPADVVQLYSADYAADHACLHIRNEDGDIVKLEQQAHIVDAPGDTCANNATTINAILVALENQGLLASA